MPSFDIPEGYVSVFMPRPSTGYERAREDFDSSPAPRSPRSRPSLQLQQRGDQLFLSGRKPGKLPLVELSVKEGGGRGRREGKTSSAARVAGDKLHAN